jgi:hypothetical protein
LATYLEAQDTIVDEDGFVQGDNLGQVGVVDVHDFVVTFFSIGWVNGHPHPVARFDFDLQVEYLTMFGFFVSKGTACMGSVRFQRGNVNHYIDTIYH